MKLFLKLFIFVIIFLSFKPVFSKSLNWEKNINDYFNKISHYNPEILVTNPFYNFKYFFYSKVLKNEKKTWEFLNQIISQIYLYRQNSDFVKYLFKEYSKILNELDNKSINYDEFLAHFFLISYIEKKINKNELPDISDELLKLVDKDNLINILQYLNDKSIFEKFYFLFRLNLVCSEEIREIIKPTLEELEDKISSDILSFDEDSWNNFKKESPYDKLTLIYLDFLKVLK
mgnify:CR=1 FL=1